MYICCANNKDKYVLLKDNYIFKVDTIYHKNGTSYSNNFKYVEVMWLVIIKKTRDSVLLGKSYIITEFENELITIKQTAIIAKCFHYSEDRFIMHIANSQYKIYKN